MQNEKNDKLYRYDTRFTAMIEGRDLTTCMTETARARRGDLRYTLLCNVAWMGNFSLHQGLSKGE